MYTITNLYIPALEGQNSTVHRNEVFRQNTSIIFNLEISNPNKGIGVYYDGINLTLYYTDAIVGVKSMPAFYQGHKKTTLHKVLVNASQQFWRGIEGGTLYLRVYLETAVKYKIFRSKTKHHQIDLEAYVPIGSDGRITGEKSIKLHHTLKLLKQTKYGNL
ncbi:hypothetical protein L1049_009612 [Liquidambar formosana]|uniref:Late embryogenesis abundant protein LEA-2 subgroup domain-containing protein n=1 Tax=Liquidambar formosana TaxID=63359 RepID=A0AAP0R0P3_LIQFO